jgi:hypothetical protein
MQSGPPEGGPLSSTAPGPGWGQAALEMPSWPGAGGGGFVAGQWITIPLPDMGVTGSAVSGSPAWLS